MKTDWSEYLDSIGITGLFLKRVEEVLSFYQKVYSDQVQDILVTEYLDKEGNRHYESVWLFSETSIMEAKQFLQEDSFDSATLSKQVTHWRVEKTDYDFDKASTKSRMVLHFALVSRLSSELRASRENCDHLKALFFKYIVPNGIGYTSLAQRINAGDGE